MTSAKPTLSRLVYTVAISIIGLYAFQNCGAVELSVPTHETRPVFLNLNGVICIEDNLEVESFYPANLNLKYSPDGVQLDTDADGLADKTELSLGSDPLNRRSFGPLLDSICVRLTGSLDCRKFAENCDNDENAIGISQCDLQALGVDPSINLAIQGFDSDNDGMSDFLEILFGTSPGVFDTNDDPDHDEVLNYAEVLRGSSPRKSDIGDANFQTVKVGPYTKSAGTAFTSTDANTHQNKEFSLAKNDLNEAILKFDGTTCEGDASPWGFSVSGMPLLTLDEFIDTPKGSPETKAPQAYNLDLSHDKDENIIALFLKLRPKNRVQSENKNLANQTDGMEVRVLSFKVQYNFLTPNITLDLTNKLFETLGESPQ